MDEVDGMSAGDRGGVGALNALIKKSKVLSPVQYLCVLLYIVRPDPHHLHSKRQECPEVETSTGHYV